jgi:RHS repeat-associated protein
MTYDRLNRPLTVDDDDLGTAADTTYTYSMTSPSWTDPSGAYAATLDKFDRPTAVNDPINATDFTWAYRADGQPSSMAQPNGNTIALVYDALGRLTSKDTTAAGPVNRALYDWTYNRAGQVLTEIETITGSASNGTVTYGYDPLARLASSTLSGTTTTYGWDKVPNRTSVQVGAGATATTTFDVANRPTSGTNPTASYTNDDDGRLTGRPNQTLEWDHLGRLTAVKDAAGTTTLARYTYDPLDRLKVVEHPGTDRVRFRYVGATTGVAQWLDDVAGTITRSVANGWTGARLQDWTGSGSNLRIHGTNAHHDTTWLASSTGTVSQSLRFDPWGTPRTTPPSGYSEFRFQGSWHDATTDLGWVVTRWYAPALGRFVSEDELLGEATTPASGHRYSYGSGDPVGRWDPDGRFWVKVKEGQTLVGLARRWLESASNWRWIWNRNRRRIKHPDQIRAGWCLWIPATADTRRKASEPCWPRRAVTGIFDRQSQIAARALGVDLRTLTWPRLIALTNARIDRERNPTGITHWWYEKNANSIEEFVERQLHTDLDRGRVVSRKAGVLWKAGHPHPLLPPAGAAAITIGDTVFLDRGADVFDDGLTAHEYIHVLQGEDLGIKLWAVYVLDALNGGGGPGNRTEAIAYLWEGYIRAYGIDTLGDYGDNQPWCYYRPVGGGWDFCGHQDYR